MPCAAPVSELGGQFPSDSAPTDKAPRRGALLSQDQALLLLLPGAPSSYTACPFRPHLCPRSPVSPMRSAMSSSPGGVYVTNALLLVTCVSCPRSPTGEGLLAESVPHTCG